MIEITTGRIKVEVQHIPTTWSNKVFFDELEKGVAQGVADGKAEIELSNFNGQKILFVMKDIPLDTPLEGCKAIFSVDVYNQMNMVHHLVSLVQFME